MAKLITSQTAETPHVSEVTAEVNALPEVTLFVETGRAVNVYARDVEYWLARGFSRLRFSPGEAARELGALFEAANNAIQTFVAGVLVDGMIDTADTAAYATAVHALREIERAWGRLERAVNERYPVAQGGGVPMLEPIETPEGQQGLAPRLVDPGQVELYRAKGWKQR